MRRNRYDPFVLLFILVFFLYCFFGMGFKTIHWEDGEIGSSDGVFHRADEVKYIEYSTGVIILPLFFLVFLFLFVFRRELEPYGLRWFIVFLKEKIHR